ncbi:MAG: HPr family phosphocarrier protein [Agathobacter sp.]|nr:HPr family phosphocarrier protein [Agathobacter sp.]
MNKEITVTSASVYDARALAELVGVANEYSSRITIVMENRSINAKSIMGVMGLGLDQGKVITIEAEGNDEAEAIAALEEFLSK